MNELATLEQAVRDLYASKNPHRANWADWLVANHVFVVADYAEQLAQNLNANVTLARAAAVLHDIADASMSRFDENHEQASLTIARTMLQEAGFSESDITLVVDDAIRYHSCHDGESPESIEGKILATADSMAHLQSDFYIFAAWAFGRDSSLETYKQWASEKLERDFKNKILFDDVREECRNTYEALKRLINP